MSAIRRRGAQTQKPSYTISNRIVADHSVAHECNDQLGFFGIFGIVVYITILVYAVVQADRTLPDPKGIHAPITEFSAIRARQHLNALTEIGSRPAGSYENDVLASSYIMKAVKEIAKSAVPNIGIEYHLQQTSGSFLYERGNLGLTAAYENITNVIVRLSQTDVKSTSAVLINAHFDSVAKTIGASDDAVSCALMLEILRTLSADVRAVHHDVIFLFNGAEEAGLKGAHGFVSQHPWMKDVKIVINLEAAGSGGREVVFQMGPEHPWIVHSYAKSAKYPLASVFAQELFEANLVPSDTDYRVFRYYGNISGLYPAFIWGDRFSFFIAEILNQRNWRAINSHVCKKPWTTEPAWAKGNSAGVDVAFNKNGYVYHTRYDDAASIPSGSIQRAGENMMALAKSLSNSPYLEDPGEFRHGQTIYFDFLGLFMLYYPKRLHILVNSIAAVITIGYLLKSAISHGKVSDQNDSNTIPSWGRTSLINIVLCIGVILMSWLGAFVASLCIAGLLNWTGNLMMWYSHPFFGMLLYGFPACVGLCLVHYVAGFAFKKLWIVSFRSFLHAHLMLISIFLLLMNQKAISSSFLFSFWLMFLLTVTCIPLDMYTAHHSMKLVHVVCAYLAGFTVPAIFSMYYVQEIVLFFLPVLGRTGTEIPSDYVASLLSSFAAVFIFTTLVPLIHFVRRKLQLLLLVMVMAVLPVVTILIGLTFPYSVDNPVAPKRLMMQLTHRTFHHSDGTVKRNDSGIWLLPLDYNGLKYVENVPFYKNIREIPCEGTYCGFPYFYAFRRIVRKNWYLPVEHSVVGQPPLTAAIYKQVVSSENHIRYYFNVSGPSNMNLFITPQHSATLSDWSFYRRLDESSIKQIPDYAGSYAHLVSYTKGYMSGNWKFWLEFKTDLDASGENVAEVAIARHYFDGDGHGSEVLQQAVESLPPFVCDHAWTSSYDSFMLGSNKHGKAQ